jgi:hypothetical protein
MKEPNRIAQMSAFKFRGLDGRAIQPAAWLKAWAAKYPGLAYDGYEELLEKYPSFSSADIEAIGKWKDRASSDGRWKPNVASVGYDGWMAAADEVRRCPAEEDTAEFLASWTERKIHYRYGAKRQTKRFGLSRATTLLHFLSGGRFPIFDSRVQAAIRRLAGIPVSDTVSWYLDRYRPLFDEVMRTCGTNDGRIVDQALFSYGARKLPFSL